MWHLEFIAEQGIATRTFVCTVPVYRRRVATEQRNIRAEERATRCWALPSSDFVGVVRGQCVGTCVFRPRQVPFYPVTSRTLFRSPGPSAILSHGGQRSRSGPGNEAKPSQDEQYIADR